MPDDRLSVRDRGGDLNRLTPEVRTLAKPSAIPLIGARGVVQRSPALIATFRQARQEGWTPERLAGAITPDLEQALECEPELSVEVAQYLADEYFQLGDAVLICDRVTGKAIARFTDADMYQPPDIRRESGNLATPLVRLNPNLEGFLVSYIFEQERDAKVRSEILATLPHTTFLSNLDDDPRVRAVTRAGRLAIAESVREALPNVLEGVQGAARAFLGYFEVVTEFARGRQYLGHPLPRRTAEVRSRQNIVDPKAMNLRFSWEAAIRARCGVGFVREMAAQLVHEAPSNIRGDLQMRVDLPLLTPERVEGRPFWTGDPGTLRAIQMMGYGDLPRGFQTFPCLPGVQGAVGFIGSPPVGTIIVHPGTTSFETREVHLRWETLARMEYTMYVDRSHVSFLHVSGIPIEATAEIL